MECNESRQFISHIPINIVISMHSKFLRGGAIIICTWGGVIFFGKPKGGKQFLAGKKGEAIFGIPFGGN
jgi:hypothetical protein